MYRTHTNLQYFNKITNEDTMMTSNPNILIKHESLGPLQTNSYLVGHLSTREAVLIDGGAVPLQLLKLIQINELNLKYVLLTHGHIDHIAGVEEVRQTTGCKIIIHQKESPILKNSEQAALQWGLNPPQFKEPDGFIEEDDKISIGELTLTALLTPGHTPGGLSYYSPDLNIIFAGDTLFRQSIGRSDLPGGNSETLITSIKTKILPLPDDTIVAPGHGPQSTIGFERNSNPFLHGI